MDFKRYDQKNRSVSLGILNIEMNRHLWMRWVGVLFMMGFSMTCESGDGNEAIKKSRLGEHGRFV